MQKHIRLLIWIFTFLVVAMGLVALYSASYQNVRVSHDVFYDQLFMALIGFGIMFALSRVDYRRFYDIAYPLYGAVVVLLILVLISGRHALGAQRWFIIAGISFQPSELAKFALILALARYFSNQRMEGAYRPGFSSRIFWQEFFIPLCMMGLPFLLIFKQPDLGTAILCFLIFLFMLFASQLDFRYIFGFLVTCLVVMPFCWHVLKPYQRDRLLVFLNPNIDPLGAGYTIIQSKIGMGSGQLFGKGWLSGTQNQLNFLPERHTDFIFSTLGEEWGLLGTLFLLFCYAVIVYAGLKTAEQVNDKFGSLVAVGVVSILAIQVVINMGMVLGMCPVVGITLPLVSYGRTSFMTFMIMMGFLLSLNNKRMVF